MTNGVVWEFLFLSAPSGAVVNEKINENRNLMRPNRIIRGYSLSPLRGFDVACGERFSEKLWVVLCCGSGAAEF
jgi:hypothetical protein